MTLACDGQVRAIIFLTPRLGTRHIFRQKGHCKRNFLQQKETRSISVRQRRQSRCPQQSIGPAPRLQPGRAHACLMTREAPERRLTKLFAKLERRMAPKWEGSGLWKAAVHFCKSAMGAPRPQTHSAHDVKKKAV